MWIRTRHIILIFRITVMNGHIQQEKKTTMSSSKQFGNIDWNGLTGKVSEKGKRQKEKYKNILKKKTLKEVWITESQGLGSGNEGNKRHEK